MAKLDKLKKVLSPKKKEAEKKEEPVTSTHPVGYDPDMPMSKQRHLR